MKTNEVKSAGRVLDLLELLAGRDQGMRAIDLAKALGMPKSSMSFLMATVEARGYVEQGPDGYRLAEQYREQGWVGGERAHVLRASRPVMASLVERTGESAFLGVLDGEQQMRYIDKLVSEDPLRYDLDLNQTRPAYSTTIGHALLSAMDAEQFAQYLDSTEFVPTPAGLRMTRERLVGDIEKVRKQGYAQLRDTYSVGASGFAAAIKNRHGKAIAALSVIAPDYRLEPKLELVRDEVCAAAKAITRQLSM